VTLEGTIIHKSGLITGGRSTHDSAKKWEEKDIQGTFILKCLIIDCLNGVDANSLLIYPGRVVACKG
jgi:hypothetical protein